MLTYFMIKAASLSTSFPLRQWMLNIRDILIIHDVQSEVLINVNCLGYGIAIICKLGYQLW